MRTFSIRAAKTHLSRLIDQAAKGESFVITKAGRPLVKVIAVEAGAEAEIDPPRSLADSIDAPADFDQLSAAALGNSTDDDG